MRAWFIGSGCEKAQASARANSPNAATKDRDRDPASIEGRHASTFHPGRSSTGSARWAKIRAMLLSEIGAIAVVGAGQMGAGIAQVCAQSGYRVLLADAALERAESAKLGIGKQLGRLREKGKLT